MDNEQIYMGTIDGRVIAYDRNSGTELWNAQVSSEVLTPPASADGIVVVRCIDGRVFGLDVINGRYQPVHHRLATYWARLVELLYAAERMNELIKDPEIKQVRLALKESDLTPGEAVPGQVSVLEANYQPMRNAQVRVRPGLGCGLESVRLLFIRQHDRRVNDPGRSR